MSHHKEKREDDKMDLRTEHEEIDPCIAAKSFAY